MRAWQTPRSPGAGGCAFAHDPDVLVGPDTALWRPELFPGVVLLTLAPPGFAAAPLATAPLGAVLADRSDREGRALVISDKSGALHMAWREAGAATHPAIVLPLDDMIELRLEAATNLVRRLRGKRASLDAAGLRLTALQKTRLIQLLHAFDIKQDGGGARDVAREILASRQAALPSVEWKDCAARRKATRLIRDAAARVNRGYLKLLGGD